MDHNVDAPASGEPRGHRRSWQLIRPVNWGISTRSAIVSATVVLVAVLAAGTGLVVVLYQSLLRGIDDAAAGRVHDIVEALDFDTTADLDSALLATDQRIAGVQIIAADGTVAFRSDGAPDTPLLPVSAFSTTIRTGVSDDASPDNDMRISGQTAVTATGRYTVIVGGGSESAEATVATVAMLLAIAAPAISAVAGVVSFRLTKRSLRSVEAIRSRVSEITAAELAERVPVPAQNDEISALARTMNAMLARIEAAHAAQRRFVGDASHELRSPLATIITALDVAQDYPETLDDELRSGTLVPEARRMQALVNDLLLLAKADEGALPLHRDTIDVDALAEAEAIRLRRDTDLAVVLSIEETTITGDMNGVSRVIRNLVDNAAHHASSLIGIDVHRHGTSVTLVVADDGPGIPETDRARVFDRFVRLDTDRSRDGGGTGLGLPIVAEIVNAHGGSVTIDERPGGGTRVTVVLPSGPI